VKLKLDENLGLRWVERLTSAGHDVDTVYDEGLQGASDPVVMDAAVQAGRALVTLDLDFSNPLRFPPGETPGIAVLRVSERPGRSEIEAVIERLVQALSAENLTGILTGHLWIVDVTRVRQYQAPDG